MPYSAQKDIALGIRLKLLSILSGSENMTCLSEFLAMFDATVLPKSWFFERTQVRGWKKRTPEHAMEKYTSVWNLELLLLGRRQAKENVRFLMTSV